MICVLVLAFLGCDAEAPRLRAAVATVNGQTISRGDLQEALVQREASVDGELLAKPGVRQALRRQVLEELITRRLLLQEAARQGVVAPPGAVEARLAELSQGYTPDEYAAMLREQGHSPESFRARVADDLTIELLLDQALGGPEAPEAEAVEAYYREHVQELHRPIRARALHLMVASTEEAGRLREEILKGADFAETARRHSLGPEAVQGGDLGWRSPGEMPEAFDEAIFSMKPGQVSPVVSSAYGYHLFKLLEVREAGVPTLEEARPSIEAKLRADSRDLRYREWMDALRGAATIVVNLPPEEDKR